MKQYPKKYEVRANSDGVGYYVVEVIAGMDMYVQGVSLQRQEMVELAKTLNEKVKEESE
jgi:hypothetical protein